MFPTPSDDGWLARFHAGERAIVEAAYRQELKRVLDAASRIVSSVDAETVAHEVFFRLLTDEHFRRSFAGGSLGPWLGRVASNAAIDLHRKRRREVGETESDVSDGDPARFDEEVEAKLLIERFCRERLPEKWRGVFETRFLRQLPQRDAANELGIQRSTLAYQEQQVRALLTGFLLTEQP